MQLDKALVCLDCDELYTFSPPAPACPVCGSTACAALWTWLPSMDDASINAWTKRKERFEGSLQPDARHAKH